MGARATSFGGEVAAYGTLKGTLVSSYRDEGMVGMEDGGYTH